MLKKIVAFGLVGASLILSGCGGEKEKVTMSTSDKGPTDYQSSGTMRCSVDAPTFDDVCGYRAVYLAGDSAQVWVTDVANQDLIRYRVFHFDGNGGFTERSGQPLNVEKIAGPKYKVSIANEHYLITHRSMTEGYKYKK